jgi:hypothetical protein
MDSGRTDTIASAQDQCVVDQEQYEGSNIVVDVDVRVQVFGGKTAG